MIKHRSVYVTFAGIFAVILIAATSIISKEKVTAADALKNDGSKVYAQSVPTLSAHQFAFPVSEGKMSVWTAEVKDPAVLENVSDPLISYPVDPEAQNGSDGLGRRYFIFTGLKEGDTFVTFKEVRISDGFEMSSLNIGVHVGKSLDPSWELNTVASTSTINYRPAVTLSGTKFKVLGETYDLSEKNSQVTKVISAEYIDNTTFVILAQTSDHTEYLTAFDTSVPNYTDWQKNSKER